MKCVFCYLIVLIKEYRIYLSLRMLYEEVYELYGYLELQGTLHKVL